MSTKAIKLLEKLNKGPLTFGDMLYSLRQTDELTQVQVAKKAKVSKGLICDVEKGRRMPTLEQAKSFAKAMGYPVEGFVSVALEGQLRKAKLKYKVKLEKAS